MSFFFQVKTTAPKQYVEPSRRDSPARWNRMLTNLTSDTVYARTLVASSLAMMSKSQVCGLRMVIYASEYTIPWRSREVAITKTRESPSPGNEAGASPRRTMPRQVPGSVCQHYRRERIHKCTADCMFTVVAEMGVHCTNRLSHLVGRSG